ncbi:hypothetical protein HNY73_005203 [Argiope bruennichi]|uniref:Uncharacterized protein n=1 Tax=Argiope bruennichi TaxID=94029 RepID=A0A8T0FGL4_ARGBR|nr:hypothetical protein HNY73_005203 [Argiope bruennichi]
MWRTSIMNMRAEKGSFRESFKHYERRESTKVLGPNRHFELVFKKGQWRIVYEDGDEVTLMYAKHERLPMKDFAAEVRASMDVDQFLNQAVLLLDVQDTSVEGIIDKMLHKNEYENFFFLYVF